MDGTAAILRMAFLAAVVAVATAAQPASAQLMFAESFDAGEQAGRVIANSYDGWGGLCGSTSPWRNDHGTLFSDPTDGSGWSGVPDTVSPQDCESSSSTGSAQLRMWTRRDDFGDIRIDADVSVNRLTDGAERRPWDGVKFYVRRHDQGTERTDDDDFYIVEPFRREGDVHIQKKRAGRYYDVVDSRNCSSPVALGQWQHVTITIRTTRSGVTLRLYRDGALLASWTDRGRVGGAPFVAPGSVGIRGDNADFNIDDFKVSVAGGNAPPPGRRRTPFQRGWTAPSWLFGSASYDRTCRLPSNPCCTTRTRGSSAR